MKVLKVLCFVIAFVLFSMPSSVAAAKHDPLNPSSEVLSTPAKDEILYSDEYFYTATRSLQPLGRVTDNVTVITREEIDRWPASDLDQVLARVSGIVVQDVGNIGQTATAQMNGSRPREVKVMIDGIPFNATSTGRIADLSQIPLDNVEKIEIVKGASSSVWGSAMGGVINIITRPVGKGWIPHGSASLSFGEFDTQRERGEVSGAAGPLHYYGSASYVESGGFRPNSDELEKRGFLKAALALTEDLSLKGSFGYSGSKVSEFDLPDISLSQKRKVYSRYGNVGFSHTWNERVDSDLFYKISERSFRRGTQILPSYTFYQFAKARSKIHEVSFHSLIHLTENQALGIGSDIALEFYRDAVFRATTTRNDVNKESTEHAYYANYQLSWRALDVTAGGRLDSASSYGVNFDPSLGAVLYFPFWNSLFRANVARAFNAPSLVDRYLSAGSTVANPDLMAEHAVVYNLGTEFEPLKGIRAKAVFFQSFIGDSIQTIVRSDGMSQPVNIASERRTGFETECRLGPWHGFTSAYDVAYVKVVDGSGVPLQTRPRFTQDIKLNYEKSLYQTDWNFNLSGRYIDLVQYTGFTAPIDQVFIFDGKITVAFPKVLYGQFSIFVIGRNLFNGDFSFDGVRDPNPQRNFEAGVKYYF